MADLLSPSLLSEVAQRFQLLGDPVRLRLLNLLYAEGEMTVQALAETAGQSHANTSKHLRLLTDVGILARRKEGLYAYYRIADPSLSALCLLVCGQIERSREVE